MAVHVQLLSAQSILDMLIFVLLSDLWGFGVFFSLGLVFVVVLCLFVCLNFSV